MMVSELTDVITLDPQRVMGMVQSNGDQASCLAKASAPGTEVRGSQLFAEASWLNHSFDSNIVSTVVCDVSFLRATRPIRSGEELTRPYMPWKWNQKQLCED